MTIANRRVETTTSRFPSVSLATELITKCAFGKYLFASYCARHFGLLEASRSLNASSKRPSRPNRCWIRQVRGKYEWNIDNIANAYIYSGGGANVRIDEVGDRKLHCMRTDMVDTRCTMLRRRIYAEYLYLLRERERERFSMRVQRVVSSEPRLLVQASRCTAPQRDTGSSSG